jgi:hypothetical protein
MSAERSGGASGSVGSPSYVPLVKLFHDYNLVRNRGRTSDAIVLNSSHISRGNIFFRNGRLMSDSTISSSESRGWRGKDVVLDLQVLMAQVTKLRVRSFILVSVDVERRNSVGGGRQDDDAEGVENIIFERGGGVRMER